MVFCISPAVISFNQTVSTLRLATKTKKIQAKEETFETGINHLAEVKVLRNKLKEKEK